MTDDNNVIGKTIRELEPIEGLVQHVEAIKPFHSKIVETLVEYVNEDEARVTISEDVDWEIDAFSPPDELKIYSTSDGGFSTTVFGGPVAHAIASPNISDVTTSYEYGFDDDGSTFTVLGDQTSSFIPGEKVHIQAVYENHEDLQPLLQVNTHQDSPSNSFVVEGDQTDKSAFQQDEGIIVVGGERIKSFIVDQTEYDSDADKTTIHVKQNVTKQDIGSFVGLQQTIDEDNSGIFEIESVEYSGGMIDSWPDINDPTTYTLGTSAHTKVTVDHTFTKPTVDSETQSYSALARTNFLSVVDVAGHSNIESDYDSDQPSLLSSPDEGTLRVDIVSQTDDSVTVDKDLSNSNVFEGDQFTIIDSSNNGTYTIESIDHDDDQTTLHIEENISNPNDVDGQVELFIPSNSFVVSGNQADRFKQGTKFDVVGGEFEQRFSTFYSRHENGYTYIRTVENITSLDKDEIEQLTNGFGIIKEYFLGFGEQQKISDVVPKTHIETYIDDKLVLDGAGIDVSDDIIAYNLENNDLWGFDIPLGTKISPDEPTIVEQSTPPSSPEITDIWFDTNSQVLRQYLDSMWQPVTTVYWIESDTEVFHYRTMNKDIDTGWVVAIDKLPTFSAVYPGTEDENAYVDAFSVERHLVYHRNVVVDTDNDFVIVTGGNWISRFEPTNTIYGYDSIDEGLVDQWNVPSIGIEKINVKERTFSVSGDKTELFKSQRYLEARRSEHANRTFSIEQSTYDSSEDRTHIKVDQRLIEEPTAKHPPLRIKQIVADTNTIIVEGHVADRYPSDMIITITNSFEQNNGDWTVDSSVNTTDDNDNKITEIEVQEDISDDDEGKTIKIERTDPDSTRPDDKVNWVDDQNNQIILPGDRTNYYFTGNTVELKNSTDDNNGEYTISNRVFDSNKFETILTTEEDIADLDKSSDRISLQTTVDQQPLHDYTSIYGAVYDPSPSGSGVYDTNGPKTIVRPGESVAPEVTNIAYEWIGPLRTDIAMNQKTLVRSRITGDFHIDGSVFYSISTFEILKTDRDKNQFVIELVDSETNLSVDLSSKFPIGSMFTVSGSRDSGTPQKSNDGIYVVKDVEFDESAGETIITIDDDMANIPPFNTFEVKQINTNLEETEKASLVIEFDQKPGQLEIEAVEAGIDGTEISVEMVDPDEADQSIDVSVDGDDITVSLATDSDGKITSTAAKVRDAINDNSDSSALVEATLLKGGKVDSFDSTNLALDIAGNSSIVLEGDHSALFDSPAVNTYRLSEPLVSDTLRDNVITVVDVTYHDGETTLFVDSILKDDTFTGSLDLIISTYFSEIDYDESNTTSPWTDGNIQTQTASVDQNVASASIKDVMIFGWGDTKTWTIVDVDFDASSVAIDEDLTSVLGVNDRVSIIGSQGLDDNYEIADITYQSSQTIITLANPALPTDDTVDGEKIEQFGFLQSDVIDITNWFQFIIDDADADNDEFTVVGDITDDLQSNQYFRVYGAGDNNGLYETTTAPTFDSDENKSTIKVDDIPVNSKKGWIQSHRDFGMFFRYEDFIGIEIQEDTEAAVETTAGTMVGAWDYPFWDVGSYDESRQTILYLYSNKQ